jgi:hypothetical protein
MISLEHPERLWALLLLALPILLHFFGRRVVPPTDFPPAVLLENDAARATRRRRLRELLQLVLRLAVLLAAVLTFCGLRTTLSNPTRSGITDRAGLVLVIDDSLSTARPADPAAPRGPTRLERALGEARAALERLGPGSEAAVVFASGRSIGPDLPAEVVAALGEARPAVRSDMGRALATVPDFLEAMRPLRPAVLVVGDCERGAIDPEAISALSSRARVAVLDIGASGTGDDWAVLGARLDRDRLTAGQNVGLLVRLARAPGVGPADSRRLELVIGGVAAAWLDATVKPGAEAEFLLRFGAERGTRAAQVRLAGADPWPLNDSRPVALVVNPPVRVAVLCRREEVAESGRAVSLALAAGPGLERKAFLASVLTPLAAAREDLSSFRAFVLLGPPAMDSALAGKVARRVADGAGAVIFAEHSETLSTLAVPLGLPSPLCSGGGMSFDGGGRLLPTRAGGPLFAPFRAATAAPVFKRALALEGRGSRVLARLRGEGRDLPGVLEWRSGRGQIVVVASSPSRRHSRLTERDYANLFVPLMHELVARAAGLPAAGLSARPGQTVEVGAAARERAARFWLRAGSGLRTPLGSPDGDLRLRFAAPAEVGAYRLISEDDGRVLAERALAVGHDPDELAGARGEKLSAADADLDSALEASAGRAPAGRDLAPLLATLGLLLLAAEMAASFVAAGRRRNFGPDRGAREKRGRAAA